MSRFDARLAKLEASAGQADEARYLQAEFHLQPAMKDLYWRCYEEGWPVSRYLDEWMALRRTLPPNPKARPFTPEQRQQEIDAMLEKLNPARDELEDIIDPYGLDKLTEEIREEEDAYLRQRGSANG